MIYTVLIQHAQDTGRYHPAYYRLAPLPGPGPHVDRYKSRGHHTEGFATEEEAQQAALLTIAELNKTGVVRHIEPVIRVRRVETAGPDILTLRSSVLA